MRWWGRAERGAESGDGARAAAGGGAGGGSGGGVGGAALSGAGGKEELEQDRKHTDIRPEVFTDIRRLGSLLLSRCCHAESQPRVGTKWTRRPKLLGGISRCTSISLGFSRALMSEWACGTVNVTARRGSTSAAAEATAGRCSDLEGARDVRVRR